MSLIQCCCIVTCVHSVRFFGCINNIGAGQVITVKDGGGATIATPTTDATGAISFTAPAGTYNFSGMRSRWTAINVNLTFACPSTLQNVNLTPDPAYACGITPCNDPLKLALPFTVSDSGIVGSGTLTYAGGTNDWRGSVVVSFAGTPVTWALIFTGTSMHVHTTPICPLGPDTILNMSAHTCPPGTVSFTFSGVNCSGTSIMTVVFTE